MTSLNQLRTVERLQHLGTLTGLMDLSSQLSAHAVRLMDDTPEDGINLMAAADRLAEHVGILAKQAGYDTDEVVAPLWD
jgi:hypothetical protein